MPTRCVLTIAYECDEHGRPTAQALRSLARVTDVRPDGTHWILWQAPGSETATVVTRVTPPAHLRGDDLDHWLAVIGGACACVHLGIEFAEMLEGDLLLEPVGRPQ